jgi:lipid-A-disaccharide synthase
MKDYKVILAGAPSIDKDYYEQFIHGKNVEIVCNQTYSLLSQAHAALVTSGTATLETALFRVPQVVCYGTSMPKLFGWLRRHVLKVKYVSLVNLIANREVVTELVADTFTLDRIRQELRKILEGSERQKMLDGYDEIWQILGDQKAPDNAAKEMFSLLNKRSV